MGPNNHVLDDGPDPRCKGDILRKKERPIVTYAVSCAKTAEPSEMPPTLVGPARK